MKKKYLLYFTSILLIISCKSINNKKTNNFTNQFFNNPTVFYNLQKEIKNTEITICDPNNYISTKQLFQKDSTKISIINELNDHCNLMLKQYTVDKNLAFVVFWKRDNSAIAFFLERGRKNNVWYINKTYNFNIR